MCAIEILEFWDASTLIEVPILTYESICNSACTSHLIVCKSFYISICGLWINGHLLLRRIAKLLTSWTDARKNKSRSY
jgi:hypothetical protein